MSAYPNATSSVASSLQDQPLFAFVGVHGLLSLFIWFASLAFTGGNAASGPFFLAFAYNALLGALLHYSNSRGASTNIWWVGVAAGLVFLLWSRPCGFAFGFLYATSFVSVRNLRTQSQNWTLPGILLVGAVVFMFF